MKKFYSLAIILISMLWLSQSSAEENCFYSNDEGLFVSTSSREDIPEKFKENATCTDKRKKTPKNFFKNSRAGTSAVSEQIKPSSQQSKYIVAPRAIRPSQVSLGRNERQRTLHTVLGEVNFRWDASAEKYFGKAAEQTIYSAMRAASRVLAHKSFPTDLRGDAYVWNIVIMDNVPSEVDISTNGQGVCHPAWMRPPSDIFLAAERIATECGRKNKSLEQATMQLEESLVHEIGHAVEFKFLGRHFGLHQRWHNEGFATWFESLAANYISGRGVNRSKMRRSVKAYWDPNWNPQDFKGSWQDYTRSYALISTIAEKRTVRSLQQVYKLASQENIPLLVAIEQTFHWDKEKFYKNVASNFELPRR